MFQDKFELARFALRDVALGMILFAVLAIGVSWDRTGGGGDFSSFSQMIATRAHATEYRATEYRAAEYRAAEFRSNEIGAGGAQSGYRVASARPAYVGKAADMTFARTDQTTAMVLLAAIFSVVFAFNLAFYRHLKRVYVTPRRGTRNWR